MAKVKSAEQLLIQLLAVTEGLETFNESRGRQSHQFRSSVGSYLHGLAYAAAGCVPGRFDNYFRGPGHLYRDGQPPRCGRLLASPERHLSSVG